MPTPIDRVIDDAKLRCTICGAAGQCGCWTKCSCGHSYQTGKECTNPVHATEEAAGNLAASISSSVVIHMKSMYPEPMKAASGGFRKTLEAAIKREAKARFIEAFNARDNEPRN